MDSIVRIASVTGIDVELRIAGPGGRSYAFVIDWHIRFLAAAAWFIAGSVVLAGGFRFADAPPEGTAYVLGVVLPSLAIYFLYHPVLELAMRGQTPGKRIAGVRLVAVEDGGVPGIGAILIRNVFRLVDSLPAFYAVGLIVTMFTKHAVRIGDIAGGTILVYDEAPSVAVLDRLRSGGVERLGLAQSELARELLERWPQLSATARTRLATELLARAGVAATAEESVLLAKLKELVA
jgi:uncharacterized RDD family membrane protein YckC